MDYLLERILAVVGILTMLGICYGLSRNRRAINWRTIGSGLLLQIFFAFIILVTPIGEPFFAAFNTAFMALGQAGKEGARFLVGDLVEQNFLWGVLPTIVIYGGVMAVLYYTGIMRWIIYGAAWVMQKTMGISAAESMAAAANVFIGQSEAPLVIKPMLGKLTNSELGSLMTGGFATVAGGVMAACVSMLGEKIPGIAGHLLAASIMSAPAAILFWKLLYPEEEQPTTATLEDAKKALTDSEHVEKYENTLDAYSAGADDATTMVIKIAGMLIAFVGGVWLLNHFWSIGMNGVGGLIGADLSGFDTLEEVVAYIMLPFAYLCGIPHVDAYEASKLLAQKTLINEFIAYKNLADGTGPVVGHTFLPRTNLILTYALCGFANFSSIGIQIGAVTSLAPALRKRMAQLALWALLAGTFACFQTACIAAIML
jgi:CNT family concentrative nucleoside transporter